MSCRVRWSGVAIADLDEIWTHIATHDEQSADAIVDAIVNQTRLLIDAPLIGRSREDIDDGVRSLLYRKRYLIFYRFSASEAVAEVMRVVDGRRNLSALFD